MKTVYLSVAALAMILVVSCTKEASEIEMLENSPNPKSQNVELWLETKTDTQIYQDTLSGLWTVMYGTTEMIVEIIDSNKCIISGDFLRGNEIGLKYSKTNGVEFFNRDFSNSVSQSTFLSYIYDEESEYEMLAPCDDHPENQTFDECVATEINNFCDGFLGCATMILSPIPVLAVIVGHCGACTT